MKKFDQEAELIFAVTMRLGGGADKFSEGDKAIIWYKAQTDKELRNQALMYLVGASERAEQNLARLSSVITEKFLADKVEVSQWG